MNQPNASVTEVQLPLQSSVLADYLPRRAQNPPAPYSFVERSRKGAHEEYCRFDQASIIGKHIYRIACRPNLPSSFFVVAQRALGTVHLSASCAHQQVQHFGSGALCTMRRIVQLSFSELVRNAIHRTNTPIASR